MPEPIKKFHYGTLVSAVAGKLYTPRCEQEYPELCAHVFSQHGIPKTPGTYFSNSADINALVAVGIEEKFPSVKEILNTMTDDKNSPIVEQIDNGGVIFEKIKGHFPQWDEQVDVPAFNKILTDRLSQANSMIQRLATQLRGMQTSLPEGAEMMFAFLEDNILREYEMAVEKYNQSTTQETPSPVFIPGASVSKEETERLPVFDKNFYAEDIQKHILSISKSKGIAVTPESFKKLEKTTNGESPKSFLSIKLSPANFKTLFASLSDAGVKEFMDERMLSPLDGKVTMVIDIGKLSDSIPAQTKLENYTRTLARGAGNSR